MLRKQLAEVHFGPNSDYGAAAVRAVVLFVILLILTVVQFRFLELDGVTAVAAHEDSHVLREPGGGGVSGHLGELLCGGNAPIGR